MLAAIDLAIFAEIHVSVIDLIASSIRDNVTSVWQRELDCRLLVGNPHPQKGTA